MNLSFRDLEYFLAMAETGHMGQAALRCGVTQSALSKSLRRLEEETGLTLFDRSARRIWLNASGVAFLEHARRLHAQYQDALLHTSALTLGEAGLLRLGATGATLDSLVLPALGRLLPQRPALRACLTVGLSDDLFDQVVQGALDMAVAPVYARTAVPDGTEKTVLREDAMHIVVRSGHPLLARTPLQLADTLDYPWILPLVQSSARQALFRYFEMHGLASPRPAMEVPFVSPGTLALVEQGDFISFAHGNAADLVRRHAVHVLPIYVPIARQLCLLTRRGGTWTPLMQAFDQTLRVSLSARAMA